MAGSIEHRLCTVLAFIVQINSIVLATDCDKDICPYDKPFCTEVGCVFRCPEVDYINGSTCVTSCGSLFADKARICRKECPSDKYISESIVRIGEKHVKIKICLDNCFQLVYNRTCLPACPLEARYTYDHECVEKCPSNHSIIYYESATNELKCSAQCLHPNVFEDDICVRECTKYNFVLNDTCVNVCPKDTALVEIQPKTNRTTCTKDCNPKQFIRNGICMDFCPNNEFIHNKTCVCVCPSMARYVYKNNTLAVWPYTLVNFKYCVPTCPRHMYIHGLICVGVCPERMVVQNRTCMNQCPAELPFIVETTNLKKCTSFCPKYIFNQTCTNQCPVEALFVTGLVNETCIQRCPRRYSFRRHNITDAVLCLRKCDREEFVYNMTCFPNCPTKANYAFTNRSCTTRDCPGMLMHNVSGTVKCVFNCPTGHTLMSDRFCLNKCPKHQMRDKSDCVNQCPKERPFIDQRSCSKTCTNETHINMTCVDRCPSYMNYTDKDHRCLNKCPKNTRSTLNSVCSDTCGEDELLLLANNSCIFAAGCNIPNVKYGNHCMDQCPYMWDDNGDCVSYGHFVFTIIVTFMTCFNTISCIILSRVWIVYSMFDLSNKARNFITKVKRYAQSINTEDSIPLVHVNDSYSYDAYDEHGDRGQSGSDDLTTSNSDQYVDIEPKR